MTIHLVNKQSTAVKGLLWFLKRRALLHLSEDHVD
jgi:hypothetical protein